MIVFMRGVFLSAECLRCVALCSEVDDSVGLVPLSWFVLNSCINSPGVVGWVLAIEPQGRCPKRMDRIGPVCAGRFRTARWGRRACVQWNYTHVQYRRQCGSGQRVGASSFDHNSKLNKYLQLGESSAMAVYGIGFFRQCGGVDRWWSDD